ncbi:MAG: hypothetical protein INR71_13005 [Terriglobus roseus]|nr:hypothetical protein [Terriglobus roseus]
MGGVSAAISKTAAAPIERVKLLIQNQVSTHHHCRPSRANQLSYWCVSEPIADVLALCRRR